MSESFRPNAFWRWWDAPARWWQFWKPQSGLFVVIVSVVIFLDVCVIIRHYA